MRWFFLPLAMVAFISCGELRFLPIRAPALNLETKVSPSSGPLEQTANHRKPSRFYQTWWFWGAVMAAGFVGAAAAIAPSIGGTDRLAKGLDGSFDAKSFPNR